MQPIIGITSDYHTAGPISSGSAYFIGVQYVSAVRDVGGVPVILPYISGREMLDNLLNRIDGLIIAGGNFDINPMFYGEEPIEEVGNIIEERTVFEIEIVRMALSRDLPLLGICGGEQLLNVVGGGDLYQDIERQIRGARNHQQKSPKNETFHSVQIEPGTQLRSILNCESIEVNSTHHQSVKRLGNGFKMNAKAEDGVVEGIESVHHRFALGVQWHPEFLYRRERRFKRLFEVFIGHCRKEDII